VTDRRTSYGKSMSAERAEPVSRYVEKLAVDNAIKKVKASHTRYRALGPELIPVYRQSARK